MKLEKEEKQKGKANNMSGRSHYTGKQLDWNQLTDSWNAPIDFFQIASKIYISAA